MRSPVRLVSAVLCLAACTSIAGGQSNARQIISRAIKAHGGAAIVGRLRTARLTLTGILTAPGVAAMPITLNDAWKLPGQYRTETQFEFNGKKVMRVMVVNGDSGWGALNGKMEQMNSTALAEMREQVYAESLDKLFPLLDLKPFALSLRGETTISGHNAIAIEVDSKEHRAVTLYFDRSTGLLVKRAEHIEDEAGKDVLREVFFSEFRSTAGG